MDGTIVDTERLVFEVIVKSFKQVQKIDLPEDTWNALLGQSEQDFFDNMQAQHALSDQNIQAIRSNFDENYLPMLADITPLSGAVELCRKLNESHPQALVTGSTVQQAKAVLDTLELPECFEFILASGQYANGKPHPEPYLAAAEKFGVGPSECLVLEDSPSGVTSAKAAGMFTVGIHEGNQGKYDIEHADVEIATLLEFDHSWLA
jgi:beta-phosphoglucomutase-like phosphatase (HAD superfamily)